MTQETRLLVSTFPRLLRVTLDAAFGVADVSTVAHGHGIYFGLTRTADRVYVVARNLDIRRQVGDPARPTNAVLELAPDTLAPAGDAWTRPEFTDLHQIRARDGLLWVVNGRAPELLAVDPDRRAIVGAVALSELVPAALRHGAPPAHPLDPYHFNSLFFEEDRLWVLAHNWDHGSFALELAYPGPGALLARPRLAGAHTGLGVTSHDLFRQGGLLHVLDSGRGRFLAGLTALDLGAVQPEGNRVFPRGLAASDEHFFVGYGDFSGDQDKRVIGATWLAVVERGTGRLVKEVEVGTFGNTCDLLLLSGRDWTDGTEPAGG